jgi:hypothetical protein
MQEPSIRTSRLAIAGGLAIAIVLGGAGFVVGRSTAPQPEPVAPVPVIAPTPALTPASEGVLRRADLIELAESATDALTSGETERSRVDSPAGQRFELVLPFGCSGPNESGPAMRWRYDEASETLRVTVKPTSWDPGQWGLDPARYEAAEGFWISRPWSSSEVCPKNSPNVPPDTDAITLPGQTLAIAQFFVDGDSRDARRDGRPYELVKRVSAADFDGSRGFLFRVTGRIEGVPDGGPIRCVQPAGAQQRPVCAIAVRMDDVAIENPVTGDVIGSWQLDTAG